MSIIIFPYDVAIQFVHVTKQLCTYQIEHNSDYFHQCTLKLPGVLEVNNRHYQPILQHLAVQVVDPSPSVVWICSDSQSGLIV